MTSSGYEVPGARIVAGHDPLVAERFTDRAGSDDVILLSPRLAA